MLIDRPGGGFRLGLSACGVFFALQCVFDCFGYCVVPVCVVSGLHRILFHIIFVVSRVVCSGLWVCLVLTRIIVGSGLTIFISN